jgi:hypothetical protein
VDWTSQHDSASWLHTDSGSDSGTAFPPNYLVNLFMDANVPYVVNIGAWVMADYSGNGGSNGVIKANLRWLTVERIWP